jgi:hypothetical protein
MCCPIADFYSLDPAPDVIVGDDAGNQAEAAIDPDTGEWVDLSGTDPLIEPDVLKLTPMWFEVIPAREYASAGS